MDDRRLFSVLLKEICGSEIAEIFVTPNTVFDVPQKKGKKAFFAAIPFEGTKTVYVDFKSYDSFARSSEKFITFIRYWFDSVDSASAQRPVIKCTCREETFLEFTHNGPMYIRGDTVDNMETAPVGNLPARTIFWDFLASLAVDFDKKLQGLDPLTCESVQLTQCTFDPYFMPFADMFLEPMKIQTPELRINIRPRSVDLHIMEFMIANYFTADKLLSAQFTWVPDNTSEWHGTDSRFQLEAPPTEKLCIPTHKYTWVTHRLLEWLLPTLVVIEFNSLEHGVPFPSVEGAKFFHKLGKEFHRIAGKVKTAQRGFRLLLDVSQYDMNLYNAGLILRLIVEYGCYYHVRIQSSSSLKDEQHAIEGMNDWLTDLCTYEDMHISSVPAKKGQRLPSALRHLDDRRQQLRGTNKRLKRTNKMPYLCCVKNHPGQTQEEYEEALKTRAQQFGVSTVLTHPRYDYMWRTDEQLLFEFDIAQFDLEFKDVSPV